MDPENPILVYLRITLELFWTTLTLHVDAIKFCHLCLRFLIINVFNYYTFKLFACLVIMHILLSSVDIVAFFLKNKYGILSGCRRFDIMLRHRVF